MRLAAYQPDIAQNLGAMIRIAACFGLPLDVIGPCGFPFSLRALRRTAMDYARIADVTDHDDWAAFRSAQETRRLVLLSTRGAVPLWDFAFRPGDTLLVGRESAGVPAEVHAAADAAVAIPMPGGGRSLNVAVSCGIAAAEALRQLRG
ncbi:tRNA (cytidine(34)-2'-O)-methyltransferase [Halovulum dunhuangense]|uniref:tRNA (cytidine(34)-2'-O)-methyltransferase n=1 Tax=Halovulum dunhuangense TaxID=1505036 RepID=A0A849L062_9RHOB|nr:tRNA (cytidine(34)-2'-O)-methyltransferase [Halovulum dunhuangense]